MAAYKQTIWVLAVFIRDRDDLRDFFYFVAAYDYSGAHEIVNRFFFDSAQ